MGSNFFYQSFSLFYFFLPFKVITCCDPGYFPCNDSIVCIEQRFNCNNVKDCPDGSDEQDCEDFHKREYWNNLFRKRPDEDREKESINNCLLKIVPDLCNCSLYNLFCEQLQLTSIPSNIANNTQILDLSGNQVKRINQSDFPSLPFLHTLILTSTQLEYIEPYSFMKLISLRSLYASGNHIRKIENDTFKYDSSISLLVLSYNLIENLEKNSFKGLKSLTELDLRNCLLFKLDLGVFDSVRNLRTLWLDGNQLRQLPDFIFRNLFNLEVLSLTRNKIYIISEKVFVGLISLRSLSISVNNLSGLKDDSFGNLTSLLKLDLRQNRITFLESKVFSNLNDLESLELRNNPFRKLPVGIFSDLQSLTHIYFSEFHFCSYAQHVRVCEPRGDGISSFQHLLDSIVLRVSVWFVAIIACAGNLFVLIGRMLMQEPNQVHSFFIKNLALADLLMGIYLFIIAYYDLSFRGEYIKHEDTWRHSWQCNLSGFLSTLSSESSIFILTVITVDRYLSVSHPLSQNRCTKAFAYTCMIFIWTVSIILALLPLLTDDLFGNEFYGNNGVCLALQIHDPFSKAWEYSTFIFCILNSAAFIYIAYAYINMSFTISSSRLGLRTTQQQQDRCITKRFGFIVGTDFLCWMPIVVIKILALIGVQINDDLYAWVAIFLLPVNSALNPILYTLTTKLFKQQFAKIIAYSLRSNSPYPSMENNSGTSFSSIIAPIRSSCRRSKFIPIIEEPHKCLNVMEQPNSVKHGKISKNNWLRENCF